MAESNATQVILTDDGLKIIKAQNTANNADSGVTDLNDPNLMSVIEKQTQAAQYVGLTSQYNVILKRAKDADISTDALTTAYTSLNTFMKALLTDTTKASAVNRDSYNSLIYAYNTALSNVQAALKGAYNTDISNMQSSVSVASQAASSAAIVASQAAITGDNANQVASRAIVAANDAQSAGNNAISVASKASQAASGAVIAGSTATVNADKAVVVANQAKTAGDNATNVANKASQAASGAVIAGSTAAVTADKAITAASQAQIAGDNATNVANKATSVANSAKSAADNTYAYANSEIAIQSTATAKAQNKADDAFNQAQAVGDKASAEILVQSTATAKAQSKADEAFSKAQSVGNQTRDEIAVQSTATAKAQSTADSAFSKAQAVGNQASSEILVQSTATAKAQSKADDAFSKAATAIDTGKVTSQAVTDLKGGSKLTIAELENGLATKVASSEYASYKVQTASQIAQKVDNGAFSAYQTTTADLIAQKVATKDFSAYQATTAKSIESKVDNGDFSTYKTQTAKDIASKVANKDFSTYQEQTAGLIESKVDNGTFSSYKTETANLIAEKVANKDFSTYQKQTADLIAEKVATKDFSAYQATTAKLIESKVESKDFNTYKQQTADEISSKVESSNFQALQTQVDNSAVGTNLIINSNFSSGLNHWNINPGDNSDCKAVVTTDSDGDTCVHITGTGTSCGLYCGPVSFNQNQVTTGSVLAKGTGTISLVGLEARSASNFGTISTKSYSKVGSTAQASSSTNSFVVYFNPVDGVIDVYVKFAKLELGSHATDWSLNPEDQATQSQITQLSGEIDLRVTKGDLVDQINIQAGNTLISSSGQLIFSGKSVVLDSVDPVVMKSSNIGNMAVGTAQIANGAITNAQIGSLAVGTANIKDAAINSAKIAKLAVGTAQIGDGAITNAKIGKLAVGTAQIANGAITDAQIGSLAVGTAQIKDEAVNSAKIAKLAVGTAQIGDGAITNAKIGHLAVGTAQIANAAITDAQVGNVSANKLTAGTIDFNTITGKNINASNITTGKLNTDRLNVNKLSALSGDLGDITTGTLKGVNIVAKTFSTPNGSFKTDSNGAITAKNMTLIGGTLTSPTINASTINGSTINGTTFNAGDIINDANNTSKLYPTTISSDGHIYTTRFNSVDAMQTDLSTGALTTKYRAINTTNPNNHYEAYDTTLQADQIALFAGHTNGKDTSFTQSVTGNNQDGYVLISPLNGLTLNGDNQQITFNGTSGDVTPKGVIITPYGNINPNGTQNIWYVGNGPTMKTASFGIDGSGANNIQFNRSLDIGNFNINTYHTITSSDSGPIHFNRANGRSGDIYAATVHYESLSKASLLSVKKDVKKADTAYWAQLVNSIDLATYQYKTDDNTSHIRLSSIVDDVNDTKQWQLPDIFIRRDEKGKLCGVDDSVLLNATLATVQEQQKEIDQLNGHLLELEARLNKLEAKLNG